MKPLTSYKYWLRCSSTARSISALLAIGAALFASTATASANVTFLFTLDGLTFEDGGTASGWWEIEYIPSFPPPQGYSATVNATTTPGTIFLSGHTYTGNDMNLSYSLPVPGFGSVDRYILQTTELLHFLPEDIRINLMHVTGPGTYPILIGELPSGVPFSPSTENEYSIPGSPMLTASRLITGGDIIVTLVSGTLDDGGGASSVPDAASTVTLLGSALALIGLFRPSRGVK
jgi:hypothetical protein